MLVDDGPWTFFCKVEERKRFVTGLFTSVPWEIG